MIRHSPLKFAISLVVALSLTACSSKPNDSVPPHLGPVPTVKAISKKTTLSPAEMRAKLLALDLQELTADVQLFSLADHQEKSLLPLSKLFFNIQFLEDPYKGKIEHDLPKALWAFQYSAIQLIDSQVDATGNLSSTGRELIDQFISIYTFGCETGTWRNCKFLEFFSSDSQTSDIIRRYVKHTDLDVKNYYRYIQLIFKPHSGRQNPELASLIMSRAIENIRRFINLEYVGDTCKTARMTTIDFTPARKEELGQFINFLIITMQTSTHYENLGLSQEMLLELFTWLQSRQIETLLGSQFSFVITKFISVRLKEKQLWPSFQSALKCQEQLAIDRLTETRSTDPSHLMLQTEQAESYTAAIWDILNFDEKILNRLNIKTVDLAKLETKDEQIYYYVASLLYQNTSFEEVLPYWESTSKDGKRMIEILDSMMRVHLIHNTLITNVSMSNIYRSEQSEKLHPSEFMHQIRGLSDGKITPLWMEYWRSVNNIRSFFEGEIDGRLSGVTGDKEIAAATAGMRDFFDYLPLNVKYLVTYPNLLMFAYYAKVLNYKEKIYIPFFRDSIEINADIILQEYLKGTLSPIFRFTNYEGDNDGIDQVEVMYSIYFAMQLNLFELYGVDPLDWFKRFVDSYLLPKKEVLRDWSKKLRGNLGRSGPNKEKSVTLYTSTMEECKQVKNFREGRTYRPILTKISPKQAFRWTFRGRLSQRSSNLAKLSEVLGGNANYKSAVPEALEIIRSDVDPHLSAILLIKNIMSKVFKGAKIKGKLTTFNDMLPLINDEVEAITSIRNEIIQSSNILDSTITDCLLTLDREEHLRQAELLQMELEFIRIVYIALDALNNLEHENKPILQLRNEYPDARIWSEPFFTELPDAGYLYSSINVLLNEKSHYTKAFTAISGYEKNFEPLIGIDNRGSYFLSYYGYDVAIRFANYLKHGFNEMGVSLEADMIEVEYPTTYKEFYADFVNWRRGKDDWQRKIDFMPSSELSFEQNLKNFQTGAILYITNSDGSELGIYKWTSFYDWQFSVSQQIRRLIQSRVAAHRLKFESEIDPKKRALCDDACIAKEKNQMRIQSKSILDLSKRAIKHVSINGMTDFDLKLLEHYDDNTFYGLRKGPTYLFSEYNASGVPIIIEMADDAYTYMTAYHLGKYSEYRGIRPGAEKSSSDKPEDDSTNLTNLIFHQRMNYWSKAKTFYKTLERQERELLLDIDPEVLSYINFSVTWRIQTEIRLIEAFEDAIEDYEINHMAGAKPLWFRTSLDPYFSTSILRGKVRSDYHSKIRDFNDKTRGIFLPKEFVGDFNWETIEIER